MKEKMQPEEAIEILEKTYIIAARRNGKIRNVMALALAINALNEKPIEAEWLFVAEAYYDVIYVCTKCGRFFTMPKSKDNDVLKLAPYCHCGAKMIKTRYEK